jgi:hypothetical protein
MNEQVFFLQLFEYVYNLATNNHKFEKSLTFDMAEERFIERIHTFILERTNQAFFLF